MCLLNILQEIYDHLPRQRRLEEETLHHVQEAIKLKANKKMLKAHFQEKTGQHITLRDIANIGAKLNRTDHNDLAATVQRLSDIDG